MSIEGLVRTTTICPEDPNNPEAKQLLVDAFRGNDILWVLVLGNDESARIAVKNADLRAQTPPIAGYHRRVVWVCSRELFKNVFNNLGISAEDPPFSVDDIENIVALGVSPEKKIKAVLIIGDTIDLIVMENLFLKAGI